MKLVAMIMITALIIPLVLADQADAQSGKQEQKIWLKVTNTKTGITHVTEWKLSAYQFEEHIPIDVIDSKVSKLKSAFGTDAFTFTIQKKMVEGTWHHFKVEVGGTAAVGEVLSVKFV